MTYGGGGGTLGIVHFLFGHFWIRRRVIMKVVLMLLEYKRGIFQGVTGHYVFSF
jgi:hypothetical protein